MDDESSGVSLSICCNFYFLRFLSLPLTSLLRFKHGIDSFATMLPFFSLEILILDGAFATRI